MDRQQPPDDDSLRENAPPEDGSLADSSSGVPFYQMRPGQFSIASLFKLTAAVAVLSSFIQWSGIGFGAFFFAIWWCAYLFAPAVIFLIIRLCPGIKRRHYKWVVASVAMVVLPLPVLLAVLSTWGHSQVFPSSFFDALVFFLGIVSSVFASMLCFWFPQTLCFWIVFSSRPIPRKGRELPERLPKRLPEENDTPAERAGC